MRHVPFTSDMNGVRTVQISKQLNTDHAASMSLHKTCALISTIKSLLETRSAIPNMYSRTNLLGTGGWENKNRGKHPIEARADHAVVVSTDAAPGQNEQCRLLAGWCCFLPASLSGPDVRP